MFDACSPSLYNLARVYVAVLGKYTNDLASQRRNDRSSAHTFLNMASETEVVNPSLLGGPPTGHHCCMRDAPKKRREVLSFDVPLS